MISRVIVDSFHPSSMQEGILFHHLKQLNEGIDIEQIVVHLPESIDAGRLQRAWDAVAERHDALRTQFVWRGHTRPRQQVIFGVNMPFVLREARRLSRPQRVNELKSFLEADRCHRFELETAPLSRLTLFQWAERSFSLVWTFHQVLLDRNCFPVLLREAFENYEDLKRGRQRRRPKPRSFHQYVNGTRGRGAARAKRFWSEYLKSFAAPTPLVIDKAIENHKSTNKRGAAKLALSRAASRKLQKLAQRHNLTLNSIVMGIWAILLHRYSGEEDVVFGATRACRKGEAGEKRIIGVLSNVVPLRANIRSEDTVLSVFKSVRHVWLRMRPFETTPLTSIKLTSHIHPSQPLFETLVIFESRSLDAAMRSIRGNWRRRRVELFELPSFPVALLASGGKSLTFKIEFDRSRVDHSSVERLLVHLRSLLGSVLSDIRTKVGAIDILGQAERKELIQRFSVEAAPAAKTYWTRKSTANRCAHHVFEDRVREAPLSLAAVDGDRRVTYRELNNSANQLAHYLRDLGAASEVRVAVLIDRSIALLTALLAILKAGGTYLPLDPDQPQQRLERILHAAGPSYLICDSVHHDQILASNYDARNVVCMDSFRISPSPCENPPACNRLTNLAYVIYTSGSTGTPKGAMVEHGGMLNHLAAKVSELDLSASDVVAQTASQAFDISVWQFLAPLLVGGCVVIMPNELSTSSRRFFKYLSDEKVTIAELVPSVLQALFAELDMSRWNLPALPSLRRMLLTGEVVPPSVLQHWFSVYPAVPVVNAYGPTECSDDVTHHTMCSFELSSSIRVPIGRPIVNTRVYLLDGSLNPVPIGVPGELYVGGAGVGRGYLNDPVRTASVFVADSLGHRRGERLYRTGDLGRWRSDGVLEYLGRVDEQVKIRGFRIELGEIEARLLEHPRISQCVVVARNDERGEKQLVGYVVKKEGAERFGRGELRGYLKELLPEHMIPGAWVELEHLPLTPNGKVDRKGLPAPDREGSEAGEEIQPRTATEELLAGIWAQVLGLEKVGVEDNFFDLGGHSLLATQVISRVRQAFGIELELRQLFESPTVARFTVAVENAQRVGDSNLNSQPPLVRTGKTRLPLSFAQQRLWFIDQLETPSALYNIPMAMRLKGRLDVDALNRALDEIVRRHEVLRTHFEEIDGQAVQCVDTNCRIAVEVEELLGVEEEQKEEEVQRRIGEQIGRPFDLRQAPMLRAQLLRITEEEHVLVLVVHHIASDGWSMEVLQRELGILYETFSQGDRSPLPDPEFQYADYAVWQREWLTGETLERQLKYWREQLEDIDNLDLPTDRARPPVSSHHGASVPVNISPELTQALRKLCRAEGVTIFMALLAAFQIVLGYWARQTDVSVGTDVANRRHAQSESLVGPLLNQVVLRTDLRGNPSFREVLSRVRAVCLGAYAHQDLPFEKLVEELNPERELGRNPLFQVMFVLQNMPRSSLTLRNLTIQPMQIDPTSVKLDLWFGIAEVATGLCGEVVHRTDLFDSVTMERMVDHLQLVLQLIVVEPDQSIAEISFADGHDRHIILTSWNRNDNDSADDRGRHASKSATTG
jgi:amino acid adenylation domain-containing protein